MTLKSSGSLGCSGTTSYCCGGHLRNSLWVGGWFIWLTVFSVVGSVDFGSVVRQSIREGTSGKGALQCPLGDKRKKALCLTVPFRAAPSDLTSFHWALCFKVPATFVECHRLENKPLLSIWTLGDILYPNCSTSPVLGVCCSILDYSLRSSILKYRIWDQSRTSGNQRIWKSFIESGTWVDFFFFTFLLWRTLLVSDPASQCYPDCLEFLGSNGMILLSQSSSWRGL